MAKFVSISIGGNPVLKLDSLGRATLQITAKNLSGVAFDARAVPVSLPILNPPSGAVQNGWVNIEGSAELHFERDQEKAIVLKVAVPMKNKPKPGSYQTRVIALGVGAWLLLKPSGPTVPDLHGQSVSDAVNTLASVGLTLDQNNVQSVESKPEDSDKIISQKPDPGQRATKGQAVQVTVGEQVVRVPMLVGHPFSEVMAILGKSLTVGQTVTAQNPNFAGGVVFAQNPPADKAVKSGTSVDLQVTPQMVTVPNVSGQTLGNAILALRGLTVTSFSGDTTKTVISQNPGQGASVPVGSSVTLAFPPGACVVARCFYDGIFAKRVASELALRAREIQQRSTPPQN